MLSVRPKETSFQGSRRGRLAAGRGLGAKVRVVGRPGNSRGRRRVGNRAWGSGSRGKSKGSRGPWLVSSGGSRCLRAPSDGVRLCPRLTAWAAVTWVGVSDCRGSFLKLSSSTSTRGLVLGEGGSGEGGGEGAVGAASSLSERNNERVELQSDTEDKDTRVAEGARPKPGGVSSRRPPGRPVGLRPRGKRPGRGKKRPSSQPRCSSPSPARASATSAPRPTALSSVAQPSRARSQRLRAPCPGREGVAAGGSQGG